MPTVFSMYENAVMPSLLIKMCIDLFYRYTKSTGYGRATQNSLADSAPQNLPSLAPEGMFRNFLCSVFKVLWPQNHLQIFVRVMNHWHASALQKYLL